MSGQNPSSAYENGCLWNDSEKKLQTIETLDKHVLWGLGNVNGYILLLFEMVWCLSFNRLPWSIEIFNPQHVDSFGGWKDKSMFAFDIIPLH